MSFYHVLGGVVQNIETTTWVNSTNLADRYKSISFQKGRYRVCLDLGQETLASI